MPAKDTEKHERLGTLGSESAQTGRAKAGDKQGLATRFRPKNFEKPEALFTTPTDRVKREPRDSQTTGPKKSHAAGSLDRKKKEAVGQDQVVFGGGIGAASRAPKRVSSKVTAEEPPAEEKNSKTKAAAAAAVVVAKDRRHTRTRSVGTDDSRAKVEVKEEEAQHDVYAAGSSSNSDDEDNDDVHRPTTLVWPEDMPRSIQDIDSDLHAEASDRIAHLFEEDGGNGLMLFQIPEKLPINGPYAFQEPSCSTISNLHGKSIGKLLITKGGKVKMKMGDILFDVTRGVECRERQELAVVDKSQMTLLTLGAIQHRIVISPDTVSLLVSDDDGD